MHDIKQQLKHLQSLYAMIKDITDEGASNLLVELKNTCELLLNKISDEDDEPLPTWYVNRLESQVFKFCSSLEQEFDKVVISAPPANRGAFPRLQS